MAIGSTASSGSQQGGVVHTERSRGARKDHSQHKRWNPQPRKKNGKATVELFPDRVVWDEQTISPPSDVQPAVGKPERSVLEGSEWGWNPAQSRKVWLGSRQDTKLRRRSPSQCQTSTRSTSRSTPRSSVDGAHQHASGKRTSVEHRHGNQAHDPDQLFLSEDQIASRNSSVIDAISPRTTRSSVAARRSPDFGSQHVRHASSQPLGQHQAIPRRPQRSIVRNSVWPPLRAAGHHRVSPFSGAMHSLQTKNTAARRDRSSFAAPQIPAATPKARDPNAAVRRAGLRRLHGQDPYNGHVPAWRPIVRERRGSAVTPSPTTPASSLFSSGSPLRRRSSARIEKRLAAMSLKPRKLSRAMSIVADQIRGLDLTTIQKDEWDDGMEGVVGFDEAGLQTYDVGQVAGEECNHNEHFDDTRSELDFDNDWDGMFSAIIAEGRNRRQKRSQRHEEDYELDLEANYEYQDRNGEL